MTSRIVDSLSTEQYLFLERHYQNKYLNEVFLKSRFDNQGIRLHYFCAYDTQQALQEVIVFYVNKREAVVANWLTKVDQQLAEDFERQVFEALPAVQCVVWSMMLNKLNTQHGFSYLESVDMCVMLPETVEQYDQMLGKNSRKLYAKKVRRIERDLDRIVIDEPCNEQNLHLVDRLTEWKDRQMKQRGEQNTVSADFVKNILKVYGSVSYVVAEGEVACVCLFYKIGKHVYYEQTAYDEKHNYYSPGRVATYLSICRFVRQGMTHFHFLWKGADYKKHYAAQEVPLYMTRSYRSCGAAFLLDYAKVNARLMLRKVARTSWGSAIRRRFNQCIHG